MQEYNRITYVIILDIIILVLAVVIQLSSSSDKPAKVQKTDSCTQESSSYSAMTEKTDVHHNTPKTDVEYNQEIAAPAMVSSIDDINDEAIKKMEKYQKEDLEARLVRDPALDYFFAISVEDACGIDPGDYYSNNGRYLDNLKLHSIHLLTSKNNEKYGELYFCYSCDIHVLGHTVTGYFSINRGLKLDKPDDPLDDYTLMFVDEHGGYTDFDEWYKQTITRIQDRFAIGNEKYLE